MPYLRKCSFTLMEMLIVMMTLTLVFSITGVKVHDIYQEQKFLSETQQVLSKLRTAQDLMLLVDADVKVHLTRNTQTDEIICQLDVHKPLNHRWIKIIEKPLTLTSIRSWEFNENSSSPLTLNFINTAMTQGTLILQNNQAQNQKSFRSVQIELLGYPAPIKIQQKEDQMKEDLSKQSRLIYPEYVYENFYKQQEDSD